MVFKINSFYPHKHWQCLRASIFSEKSQLQGAARPIIIHIHHKKPAIIPFKLTNVPASEQELINNIFRDILNEYIIIYLDDILMYCNRTLDNYIKKVYKILKQFNRKNLRFKPEKYHFH